VELLKAGGIKDAEVYDEKGLQTVRWHKIAVCISDAVKSHGDRELISLVGIDQRFDESLCRTCQRHDQCGDVTRS